MLRVGGHRVISGSLTRSTTIVTPMTLMPRVCAITPVATPSAAPRVCHVQPLPIHRAQSITRVVPAYMRCFSTPSVAPSSSRKSPNPTSLTADERASKAASAIARTSLPPQVKQASQRLARDFPGWETMIGIEVHAQVISQSKLFSGASTDAAALPNSNVSVVDIALPGTLPVLNRECVSQAIRLGLGLRGRINPLSYFERKHYFYCDLPQGYQITQQSAPIVTGGAIVLDSLSTGVSRSVRINRLQLEQDSGKSVHNMTPGRTHVDLNRAGVALIEIVGEPDIRSIEEADAYLRRLAALLRHLGICNARSDEGSLRCDVNISVRRVGDTTPGQRVEIKNLAKLRAICKAIEYEIRRQIAAREAGQTIERETRGFDADTGVTVKMRSKEDMLDYRFFPEPDLPPLRVSEQWINEVKASMPELPEDVRARFKASYGLSPAETAVLQTDSHAIAFFEDVVAGGKRPAKKVLNWVSTELFGRLRAIKLANATGFSRDPSIDDDEDDDSLVSSDSGSSDIGLLTSPVTAERLGQLIDMVEAGTISGKVGKEVLTCMMTDDRTPMDIVTANNWAQISDPVQLGRWVTEVFAASPDRIATYAAAGDGRIRNQLCVDVIARSSGRANPAVVDQLVRAALPTPAIPERDRRSAKSATDTPAAAAASKTSTSSSSDNTNAANKRDKIRSKKPSSPTPTQ